MGRRTADGEVCLQLRKAVSEAAVAVAHADRLPGALAETWGANPIFARSLEKRFALQVKTAEIEIADWQGDPGPSDLVVGTSSAPRVVGELKWFRSRDKHEQQALWDLFKMVLATRMPTVEAAFLIAGASEARWATGNPGAAFYSTGKWTTEYLFRRYGRAFIQEEEIRGLPSAASRKPHRRIASASFRAWNRLGNTLCRNRGRRTNGNRVCWQLADRLAAPMIWLTAPSRGMRRMGINRPLEPNDGVERTRTMNRMYLPTTGSHDWQWLLAIRHLAAGLAAFEPTRVKVAQN
jgi:hypothetical protein